MSETLYVPVVPTQPTTSANSVRNASNTVMVKVDYSKGRGIVASAYPVARRDGINSILITSGEYLLLDPAPRLNRKKVALCLETAAISVAHKMGSIWELVQKVCAKNGLTTDLPVNTEDGGQQ